MLSFLLFSVKRAWQGFWRNAAMSLAATATMTLMLLLLASFWIVQAGFLASISYVEDKVGVVADLEGNATNLDIRELQGRLEAMVEVRSVDYISKEEALARYREAREAGEVVPVEEHGALGGELVADQELHERGLARARGPDEEDEVALWDHQIDVLEGIAAVGVGLRDVVEHEDRAPGVGGAVAVSAIGRVGLGGEVGGRLEARVSRSDGQDRLHDRRGGRRGSGATLRQDPDRGHGGGNHVERQATTRFPGAPMARSDEAG
jgi:hypothetical protein